MIFLFMLAAKAMAIEPSYIDTLPKISDFKKACQTNKQTEALNKMGMECGGCNFISSGCKIFCVDGFARMDQKYCVPLSKIGDYVKERDYLNSLNRPDVVWCKTTKRVVPRKQCLKSSHEFLISDNEAANFFKGKGYLSFCDQLRFGWKGEYLKAAEYLQNNYHINCPKVEDSDTQNIAKPKTVVPKVDNDETISASSGSGFAVSKDGYIVTNNHVVDGCKQVYIHSKGKKYLTDIVSFDTQNDLALLKGNFEPLIVLPISNNKPQLAQDIYVSGYPFGHNISSSVKVTKGIISSLTGIGNNLAEIQIDAALQSGNSGGPILDEYGNLVGVAVAKLDVKYMLKNFGAIPENTNFGVKANIVEALLDANGVEYEQGTKSKPSGAEFSKILSDGTYYISCWMTLAQIEAMKTKKVMFSDLN